MKYLIWRNESLEENLEAFNALNNLGDSPLTPLLQQWAMGFQLTYPNNMGTQKWAEPLICLNPDSEYYNAVAMQVLDVVYQSLDLNLISDLQQIGIKLPDEGIESAVAELPADWNPPILT